MKLRKLKRMKSKLPLVARVVYRYRKLAKSFIVTLDSVDTPPSQTYSFDHEVPLKPYEYLTNANAY